MYGLSNNQTRTYFGTGGPTLSSGEVVSKSAENLIKQLNDTLALQLPSHLQKEKLDAAMKLRGQLKGKIAQKTDESRASSLYQAYQNLYDRLVDLKNPTSSVRKAQKEYFQPVSGQSRPDNQRQIEKKRQVLEGALQSSEGLPALATASILRSEALSSRAAGKRPRASLSPINSEEEAELLGAIDKASDEMKKANPLRLAAKVKSLGQNRRLKKQRTALEVSGQSSRPATSDRAGSSMSGFSAFPPLESSSRPRALLPDGPRSRKPTE